MFLSPIVLSFLFFLLMFVVIGVLSVLKQKSTNEDYLLAGQNIKPWLAALSAVATNNSGYMFIGMIGFTYLTGISSIWLMIGWLVGDLFASLFIHAKLRVASEKRNAMSFASTLSNWSGKDFKSVRIVGGILTILFLGTYAAAQFSAGSKALHVLFGWDYSFGAIIGSIIVVLYCWAGGIRASIWTDAAQSFVMIAAMATLLGVAIAESGGIGDFWTSLAQVGPHFLDPIPRNLPLGGVAGPILFIMGWFAAGFGVVGQPHIMVRFMTIEHPKQMARIRLYYYSWYFAFYMLTIGVGLSARLFLPEIGQFDPELAMPSLAQLLLPEVLIGLILAGLFSATMSTADSQILSCSAALTCDLFPGQSKGNYILAKSATVLTAFIALLIALNRNESVFQLVLVSWSALASAFAPLLTVYALKQRPSEPVAVSMMLVGFGVMLAWYLSGLSEVLYDIVPGMLAGFLVFIFASLYTACFKSKTSDKNASSCENI
ncbi:MAG: sodium/proline symporter [Vampirovibrionales bacterium]|nr:sodium/proline symporter [Vampirovibrionales bacterium]